MCSYDLEVADRRVYLSEGDAHAQVLDYQAKTLMQIEITVDATQFLRARGGALYAWEERDPDSGDRRVRTSYRAPRGARDFVEYHRPGVTFLRESSLPAPRVVSVSLRRFPFTRLLVRYGGSSAQEQLTATDLAFEILEIGRASCRERVFGYV